MLSIRSKQSNRFYLKTNIFFTLRKGQKLKVGVTHKGLELFNEDLKLFKHENLKA